MFHFLRSIFMLFWFWIFGGVFIFAILAESQRAPFDFAEGERELVRGFNVEYSSVLFSVIFLTEYGVLLFFCWVFRGVFFGIFVLVFGVWLCFFVVVIRGSLPRFRFDFLQIMAWKLLLPASVGALGVLFTF